MKGRYGGETRDFKCKDGCNEEGQCDRKECKGQGGDR